MSSNCHSGPVTGVRLLSSGCGLVTSGEDGEVKVWAVEQGVLNLATLANDTVTPHRLAHQRTIHKNKGPVTNMEVLLTERQVRID